VRDPERLRGGAQPAHTSGGAATPYQGVVVGSSRLAYTSGIAGVSGERGPAADPRTPPWTRRAAGGHAGRDKSDHPRTAFARSRRQSCARTRSCAMEMCLRNAPGITWLAVGFGAEMADLSGRILGDYILREKIGLTAIPRRSQR
jgi:hypothetical protein